MNEELYQSKCDEAQQYLRMAREALDVVQAQLFKAGHPGVRLANRKVTEINDKIRGAAKDIDMLPAGNQ